MVNRLKYADLHKIGIAVVTQEAFSEGGVWFGMGVVVAIGASMSVACAECLACRLTQRRVPAQFIDTNRFCLFQIFGPK